MSTVDQFDQRYYSKGQTFTKDEIVSLIGSISSAMQPVPATPATNPGTPVQTAIYPATPGTYPNFKDNTGVAITIPATVGGNPVLSAFIIVRGAVSTAVYTATVITLSDYTKVADFNSLTAKLPFIPSKNLFDMSQVIVGSFVSGGSGNISTGLGSNYAMYPMAVTPLTSYTLQGNISQFINGAVRYEDAAGVKINWSVYSAASPFTFTTPANCVRIYLDVKNNAASDYNTIQIELGSAATSYVPFAPVLPKASLDLSGILTQTAGDVRYVLPLQTRNLFLPANVVFGSFVAGSSGNIGTGLGNNYAMYPMVVTPNTTYTLQGNITQFVNGAVRFEDAAGVKLAWAVYSASSPFTFTTPANCVKAYLDVKNNGASDFSTIQIELGAAATSYVPAKVIDNSLMDYSGLSGAKYSGLKIAFLTDSFGGFNVYQPVVNGILKSNHVNFSLGGSAITPGFESLPNGSGDQRASGFSRADQLTTAAKDIIVVQMSVNDVIYMNQSNPNSNPLLPSPLLGTITDAPLTSIPGGYTTNGVGATITFASALKGLIVKLMTNNPNTPLFFIGPTPQFYNTGFSRDKQYSTQEPFADLMKQICANYGFPYADAFHSFGINYENKAVTTRDNLHPTDAYFIQYGKKLSGFLLAH